MASIRTNEWIFLV